MDDFNQQNQPPQNKPKETMLYDGNDKKQGAIIYFLGIIIVSVIAVGYLIFKILGFL